MVLVNVEAAVKVNKRLDFFSWVQGVFQGIIAHEALVCGIPHPPARRVRFEWLASYPISDDRFGDLCRHDGGVMHELSDRWEQGGRAPLLLGGTPAEALPAAAPELVDAVRRLEQANGFVHGLPGLVGEGQEQQRDRADPEHQPPDREEPRADDLAEAQRAEPRTGSGQGHQSQPHALGGLRRAVLMLARGDARSRR